MNKLRMLAAIVVVVSSCAVVAQERKPSPEGAIELTNLLLEVKENKDLPPGYSEVNGPGETSKWIWVTRFVRIPGRQIPGKPIAAVRLEPVFNGQTANVKVTLLRGSKGFEQEDLVGVYQVAIGEQKTVADLDQYGIEPFNITLLHTLPPLPPPPGFDNLTKAIEVVNVQAENFPRPAYKIAFRNISDKSVRAMKIETITDGRNGEHILYQGEDGRAFLEPGATIEKKIAVIRGVRTATGYAPGTPASVIIGIRTVVFDDMSFEGEVRSACSMESFVMGRRLWLKRVLPMFEEELTKSNSDQLEAAKQFKERLSALSFDVDESEQDKGSSMAPGCPKPARSATVIMNGMKVDLVRELERMIGPKPLPSPDIKTWLEGKRTRYAAWLARL